MSKKRLLCFVLILVLELIICGVWLGGLTGQQELSFGQDQMQISQDIWGAVDKGETELPAGFYVDHDVGASVVTPTFFAKRGIYDITVEFMANGPSFPHECISRVVAVDNAFEAQGGTLVESESADLIEGSTSVSYRADLREGTYFRVVNAIDSQDEGRYILVNRVTVTRLVKKTLLRDLVMLLTVMLFLDVLLFLFFFRVEQTKRWLENNGLILGALIGLTLFACFPLTRRGVYFGDDILYHLRRIHFLAEGLSEGVFPVKIQNWSNGYGYAVGVGYGDPFLIPSALLYLLGYPLSFCYDFYIVLMTVLAVICSYAAFLRIGESRLAGLTGSTLYVLTGFRLHSVYAGGTAGEFGAFSFLPLVLLGLWEIYSDRSVEKDRRRGALILAVGASCLIGTHVLTTLLTAIAAFFFCLLWIRRTLTKPVLFSILKALGKTILLSFWFMVPVIHFLAGDVIAGSSTGWVFWEGAIDPVWLFLAEADDSAATGGFYAFGFVTFVILTVFLMLLFSGSYRERVLRGGIVRASFLFLFYTWMATTWFPSHWLSTHFALLDTFFKTVQMPMHFLDVAALLLTMIAVCCIRTLWQTEGGLVLPVHLSGSEADTKNVRIGVGLAAAAAVLFVSVAVMQSGDFMGHVVREGRTLPYMTGRMLGGPWQDEFSLRGTEYPPTGEVVEIDQGEAAILGRRGTTITAQIVNPSQEDTTVRFPLWAYPGYEAKGESGRLTVREADDHRVEVEVPAGYTGTVTVRFREPWFWRLSELVSLCAWILLILECRGVTLPWVRSEKKGT